MARGVVLGHGQDDGLILARNIVVDQGLDLVDPRDDLVLDLQLDVLDPEADDVLLLENVEFEEGLLRRAPDVLDQKIRDVLHQKAREGLIRRA